MPMTRAQQEYAIKRVSELHQKETAQIKAEHSTPAVTLNLEQRWELVQTGKVSLKQGKTPGNYERWHEIFDFSNFESPEVLSYEGQKLLDAENQRLQDAKDQIMLGDAMEAMNIVSNY